MPRAQCIVRVREQSGYPKRSGGGTDLAIGCVDPALEWIDRAISQDEFKFQLPQAFISVALRGKELGKIDVSLLGHVVIGFDGVNGRDRGQFARGGSDQVANLPIGDAGNSIDG